LIHYSGTSMAGPVLLAALALYFPAAFAQQKGNPAAPCYQALAGDPRFVTVREKVALGGSIDEMRSFTKSTERASAQEAPVLAAWRDARAECHRLEEGYYATRDAEIEALARKHFAAVQSLISELQSARIGYGEFGRRRLDLYEKLTANIEEIRRRILPPKLPPSPITK
jgi:hypothetical protein